MLVKGFKALAFFVRKVVEIGLTLLFLLLFTLPFGIYFFIRKLFTRKNVFVKDSIYGKNASVKRVIYFNSTKYYLRNLPLFFYVLGGQVQLVGPSIKKVMPGKNEVKESYIYSKKPGIFNLWFIWESSRIPGKNQIAADLEYLSKKNLFYDLLLIFKSIPAFFYYQDSREFKPAISLLGVNFLNIDMAKAIDIIDKSVSKKQKSSFFFMNPDCFNKIFTDDDYLKVLNSADYIFPDGIGITIACKMIKAPLKENINGTDLFPHLCERAVKKGYSIYLLGAAPGIAETVKENTQKEYPGIRIVGFRDGYFDREKEIGQVISCINQRHPDILLVALGAPAQEKWISRHKAEIDSYALMGVGGLFDFYSGKNKRAPRWMREIGLEWVYRIMQEPGRMWKRYLFGNPLFLYRVWKWNRKK